MGKIGKCSVAHSPQHRTMTTMTATLPQAQAQEQQQQQQHSPSGTHVGHAARNRPRCDPGSLRATGHDGIISPPLLSSVDTTRTRAVCAQQQAGRPAARVVCSCTRDVQVPSLCAKGPRHDDAWSPPRGGQAPASWIASAGERDGPGLLAHSRSSGSRTVPIAGGVGCAALRCGSTAPYQLLSKWNQVVSTTLVTNLPAQRAGTVVTGKDAMIHTLDALVSCMCRRRPMQQPGTLTMITNDSSSPSLGPALPRVTFM
jgi:hypothetical protein